MVQEEQLAVISPDSTDIEEIVDSLAVEDASNYGLVMDPVPPSPQSELRPSAYGVSFILVGLFLLLLVIALRFRENFKFAGAIFKSLIETRTRHNVFDDTVKETSILLLLNFLWCVCAGIIAYCFVSRSQLSYTTGNSGALGMVAWMIVALIYTLFMTGAYGGVGWVFSDRIHATMWVKGFAACQGLMTPALFLIALIAVAQPMEVAPVGWAAAICYISVKLIFIWKGYMIFFKQISSWVLFLCYLCSLEVVPLILTYRIGCLLGEVL